MTLTGTLRSQLRKCFEAAGKRGGKRQEPVKQILRETKRRLVAERQSWRHNELQ